MKRISVVLGLAALMAAVIAGPVSAQAVTETSKETFALSNVLDDCEGGVETIVVESIARVVVHTTTDENGGIHSFVNLSLHGVTATDANGETVHFSAQEHDGLYVLDVPTSGTFTHTFTQTSKAISSGPSDNRFITTLMHLTVNANGEVTSETFDQTIECRG
jgi:hypothetical protein